MMHVKIRERCFQTVEYVVARTGIPSHSGDVYLLLVENFLRPIRASLFPQPLQPHSRAGQTFLHNILRLALLVAAVDILISSVMIVVIAVVDMLNYIRRRSNLRGMTVEGFSENTLRIEFSERRYFAKAHISRLRSEK